MAISAVGRLRTITPTLCAFHATRHHQQHRFLNHNTRVFAIGALNNKEKSSISKIWYSYTNCDGLLCYPSLLPKKRQSIQLLQASSSSSSSSSKPSIQEILSSNELLDPQQTFGKIPMPAALSPSAAAEFKNCPQSYLFQYLYKIRQPTNLALAKGSMCHSALEEVFNLEPKDRSIQNLQNLFRKVWSKNRLSEEYGHLFEEDGAEGGDDDDVAVRDLERESEWGNQALRLLENYYELEDPRLVPRPNPLEREIWVNAKLTLDPSKGVTGGGQNHDDDETFLVRGIVDRLDYVAIPLSPSTPFSRNTNGEQEDMNQRGAIRIIDYKTGKAPNFKYSPAMNEKIANESIWQLKIYALLLQEMIANGKARSKSGNLQNVSREDMRLLRLMYLTSEDGSARYLDLDLGDTQEERDEALQEVHRELSDIWKEITNLVEKQDPRAFKHCDRRFCFCHTLRPKFVPGTVAE